MDFSALCSILKEKKGVIAYWRDALKQHQLIEPRKGRGNKDIYREEDVQKFIQIKQFLNDGVPTVSEAIRLMKNNITPEEAFRRLEHTEEKFQRAQMQIAHLQSKVVELRSSWHRRILEWFKAVFVRLRRR